MERRGRRALWRGCVHWRGGACPLASGGDVVDRQVEPFPLVPCRRPGSLQHWHSAWRDSALRIVPLRPRGPLVQRWWNRRRGARQARSLRSQAAQCVPGGLSVAALPGATERARPCPPPPPLFWKRMLTPCRPGRLQRGTAPSSVAMNGSR